MPKYVIGSSPTITGRLSRKPQTSRRPSITIFDRLFPPQTSPLPFRRSKRGHHADSLPVHGPHQRDDMPLCCAEASRCASASRCRGRPSKQQPFLSKQPSANAAYFKFSLICCAVPVNQTCLGHNDANEIGHEPRQKGHRPSEVYRHKSPCAKRAILD